MVGYNDPYNHMVTKKAYANTTRHAENIDCLNGSGKAKGGSNATPYSAKNWFKSEDRVLADTVKQTITPPAVRRKRMELDLGAGIDPKTPRVSLRGGARDEYSDEDEYDALVGGGADDGEEEPETLTELRNMSADFNEKRMTGGAMTKQLRMMLPHGSKGGAVAFSKMLQSLRRRGRGMSGGASGDKVREIHDEAFYGGSKKLVGGYAAHNFFAPKTAKEFFGGAYTPNDFFMPRDAKQFFGWNASGKSGGNRSCRCCRMSGGQANFAPTVEALGGYDNSYQPRGLVPPPSVNQQQFSHKQEYEKTGSGMSGGALPLHTKCGAGRMTTALDIKKKDLPKLLLENELIPDRLPVGKGRMMVPDANKRGNIGGSKPSPISDGAIIPNLQSDVTGGSRRSARGAAVSAYMKKHGCSLGEASRAIKTNGF